jgi:hypothetical protein
MPTDGRMATSIRDAHFGHIREGVRPALPSLRDRWATRTPLFGISGRSSPAPVTARNLTGLTGKGEGPRATMATR